MKRLFAFVALLFAPLLSLADGTSFLDAKAISNHTDLSVSYLSQLFGTVGNVLQGTSGQMLGHMLYKFNEGIVVVAGLWLGYSVFVMVLRAAGEGSFLGQNKNVHLLFLRIALGFALLIPNPTTGYNLLQDFVMKITVAGAGLADETWDYALNYLNNGGVVWHQPAMSGGSGGLNISDTYQNSMLGRSEINRGLLTNIFGNEVCMLSSTEHSTDDASDSASSGGVSVTGTAKTQFNVVDDPDNLSYDFGGLGGNSTNNNACGSISYNINNSCSDAGSAACLTEKHAVYQSINMVMPAAQEYFCSIDSTASSCNGVDNDNVAADNEQNFLSALVGFANGIYPNLQKKDAGKLGFIKTAKAEGWLSAGRYYWDLAQTSWSVEQAGEIANYVPTGGDLVTPSVANSDVMHDYNNALNAAYTSESSGYKQGVQNLLTNLENGNAAGGDANNGSDPGVDQNGKIIGYTTVAALATPAGLGAIPFLAFITPTVIDLNHLIGQFSGQMSSDPIVFLHNVGMACFNISGDIWFLTGIILSLAFIGTGACNSMYNATAATKALVSWTKGFFFALATALFLVGAILGFYIPLYPYIIFTFGVLGWMISVIEAMVAAPLVCFGLTHPEGHDFLGPVQQSVMLFLSVFLRPVLLLIGLIAGMILSYVSLRMVIYTFTGITSDLFNPSAGGAGSAGSSILHGAHQIISHSAANAIHSGSLGGAFLLSIVSFPIILALFTIIVFVVTTTCYQLPNQFVNYIMTWIGGPQIPNMASQMVQQIQSAFGAVPGKMPEAARAGGQAFEQTMRDETMKDMARKERAMHGKPTGGGASGGGGGGGGGGRGRGGPGGPGGGGSSSN